MKVLPLNFMNRAFSIAVASGLLAISSMAAPPAASETDCVALDGKASQPNVVDSDGRITRFRGPALRLLRTKVLPAKGTVLILPSGGYHVLSVVSDGLDKARFWNDLGYDVGILEYTISEKGWQRDDAVRDRAKEDALSACALLRTRGKELGLHSGRFIMMGASAGGHLAARTIAALPEKDRPDLFVLFYPAYLEEVPSGAKEPGLTVPVGKLPRLFTAIASDDNAGWVKGACAYAEAWEKAGGKAKAVVFADGGHGFRPGSRAADSWQEMLGKFQETE